MNCKLASSAAQDASDHMTAFDPTLILSIIQAAFPVITQLMSLCNPKPTPATTRQFVTARYNQRRGRYQRPMLNRVTDAMAEKGDSTLGTAAQSIDYEQMAISTLDSVRNGSDDDIQEALTMAATG